MDLRSVNTRLSLDVMAFHLRNNEGYTARLTEDLAQGRAQSGCQECRGEIDDMAPLAPSAA